jgi:hypothetical protein
MAKYAYVAASATQGNVSKDGVSYDDVDTTDINNTWRAVQWNGTSGRAELCDGTDFDVNTGEQVLTSESEIQSIIDIWQTADDAATAAAEQAAIEAAEIAAAEAALEAAE